MPSVLVCSDMESSLRPRSSVWRPDADLKRRLGGCSGTGVPMRALSVGVSTVIARQQTGVSMRVRFFAVAVAALFSVVVAASCSGGTVDFVNESNRTLVIMEIDTAGESVYAEIDATGGMAVLKGWFDGCIDGDLEARLEDGTVIDTRPGPFCHDDPAWLITQQDIDQARSASE